MDLRDDAGLLANVRALGGPGVELLDDPRLLEIAMPAIRADYAAVGRYEHRPGPLLTCPVTALTGDDDPVVTPAEAREWADRTTGPFALQVFPGRHFYLIEHADAARAVVEESL